MASSQHAQIGDVAERVGLSLRTIRYYEEIGLVEPSGRTEGGFRLYRERDIERLLLVKALKPLGMTLEDLTELLDLCGQGTVSDAERERRRYLLSEASKRADRMARQLAAAREMVDRLADLPTVHRS